MQHLEDEATRQEQSNNLLHERLKKLIDLAQQRTPGRWRKNHEAILAGDDVVVAMTAVGGEWHYGHKNGFGDFDFKHASANARFIVALAHYWPHFEAMLRRAQDPGFVSCNADFSRGYYAALHDIREAFLKTPKTDKA